MKDRRRNFFFRRRGFSLVELSLVLLVLSFLIASGLTVAAYNARQEKQRQLTEKMDRIEQALRSFVRQHGHLPCPAPPDTTNYLSYETDPAVCTSADWGSKYYTSYGVTQSNGDSSNVVVGILPARTLGITDDTAVDPWGNYFTYGVDTISVNRVNTYSAALNFYRVSSGIGKITIKDSAAGNTLASNGLAVLISHGPNGNGGWPYGNTASSTISRPGGSDDNELKNCHCDADGERTGMGDATFVQRPYGKSSSSNADTFDDSVRYYKRGDFLSPIDIQAQ